MSHCYYCYHSVLYHDPQGVCTQQGCPCRHFVPEVEQHAEEHFDVTYGADPS